MYPSSLHRRRHFVPVAACLLGFGFCFAVNGQWKQSADLPAAVSMPFDRAEDSYKLYSALMPVGESANPGWPHALWLLEDTTKTLVPPNEPCWQAPVDGGTRRFTGSMNPHEAVHPTADRQQDFDEILEDFDKHCHERVKLDGYAWKLPVPVRVLTEVEQKEFQSTRFRANPDDPKLVALREKYIGAPGLFTFSEVYFNAHHTVALVYAGVWCGGLCGTWDWNAFVKENGQWKRLHWNSTHVVS